MPDSNPSDGLAAKHNANRADRIAGIKRWVEYIKTHPPSDWGAQQNRLVNSQLESARETATSVAHEQRVRAFGEAMTQEGHDDESDE